MWETSVPIPNTTIKPQPADDTWWVTARENRWLPDSIKIWMCLSINIWAYLDFADVAQLAEQLTCNQQVIGSSPIIGFSNKFLRALSSVG